MKEKSILFLSEFKKYVIIGSDSRIATRNPVNPEAQNVPKKKLRKIRKLKAKNNTRVVERKHETSLENNRNCETEHFINTNLEHLERFQKESTHPSLQNAS